MTYCGVPMRKTWDHTYQTSGCVTRLAKTTRTAVRGRLGSSGRNSSVATGTSTTTVRRKAANQPPAGKNTGCDPLDHDSTGPPLPDGPGLRTDVTTAPYGLGH